MQQQINISNVNSPINQETKRKIDEELLPYLGYCQKKLKFSNPELDEKKEIEKLIDTLVELDRYEIKLNEQTIENLANIPVENCKNLNEAIFKFIEKQPSLHKQIELLLSTVNF